LGKRPGKRRRGFVRFDAGHARIRRLSHEHEDDFDMDVLGVATGFKPVALRCLRTYQLANCRLAAHSDGLALLLDIPAC
jgi:hypothetical protein